VGTFTHIEEDTDMEEQVEPLGVENTMWMNTVLASGSAIGFVIYTGNDTRAVMNTNHPETKVGLIDVEINRLAKVRCKVSLSLNVYVLTFSLSIRFSSWLLLRYLSSWLGSMDSMGYGISTSSDS
jgi:phospholipid-translocating ATPase